MPRQKRKVKGGKSKKSKDKHQTNKNKDKHKNRNKNKNVYSPQRIKKEVNEIRMLIANNDSESAMNKINTIDEYLKQQNKTLPLILNSLKCAILAQLDEYEALKLVFNEIMQYLNSAHYEWDADSLNCLQNACMQCGEIEHLMIFLESAFNSNTANVQNTEEISRALYVAYLINAQYDKLSQLAQKMKRTFKHNSDEYTLWTIIGPLMKIILNHFHYKYKEIDVEKLSTQLNKNEDTILKLQQLQFERQFIKNKNQHNTGKIVNIYHRILKLRKEWQQLSESIDCESSDCDTNNLKLLQLECCLNLNKYKEVNNLCSSLLFESNNLFLDDYQIWSHWMDSHLVEENKENSNNKQELIQQIKDIQTKHNALRAPYLAEIEFNLRWNARQQIDTNDNVLITFIIKYFKHFASRNSCCFDDIKKYLKYDLDEKLKVSMLHSMKDYVTKQEATRSAQLKLETCYYEIELYLGLWMKEDTDTLINRVQELYRKWYLNIYKIEKEEKTDETDADSLLLICVHILLYLAFKSDKDKNKARNFIMNAIFLLESGIIRSAFNFRLKLYLLRLYCHPLIGNIHGAFEQFESMKVRGVQYDSLSHTIYHDASRYGFTSKIDFFHHEMKDHRREFNIANLRRTPQCFEFKNYHKVIEFAEFNYVMKQSEMFLISQSEFIVNKVLNYYQKKQKQNIIDYFEAFILPQIPTYLNKDEDEHKTESETECEYIDVNDYKTIPLYINEDRQSYNNYYYPLILCPLVSSLSFKAYNDETNKLLKQSHIKLLPSFVGMLYKSLTFNTFNNNEKHKESHEKQLVDFWKLLNKLKFVENDALPFNDINKILSLCNSDNYHWILVFCFYVANVHLFEGNENERFISDVSLICDRFCSFADELQKLIKDEVNKDTKYLLNGIHLQRIWRFISILCLTSTSLFKYWLTQTNETMHVNKIIMNQQQVITKIMDKLKRTFLDIVEDIKSEYKVIDVNIDIEDKVLKHYRINTLLVHESIIDLEEKNKTKLRDIKIALINMNNNIIQNNVHILKHFVSILKQFRSQFS